MVKSISNDVVAIAGRLFRACKGTSLQPQGGADVTAVIVVVIIIIIVYLQCCCCCCCCYCWQALLLSRACEGTGWLQPQFEEAWHDPGNISTAIVLCFNIITLIIIRVVIDCMRAIPSCESNNHMDCRIYLDSLINIFESP